MHSMHNIEETRDSTVFNFSPVFVLIHTKCRGRQYG